MDLITIEEEYRQIVNLLEQHRLKEALVLMDSLIQGSLNYQLQDKLQAIQTPYHFMLQYMEQGMKDPDRGTLFHDLLTKAYELADQTYLVLQENLSQKFYSAQRKLYKKYPKEFSLMGTLSTLESFQDCVSVNRLLGNEEKMMEDLQAHEEALHHLFMKTWTNSSWSASEKEAAYKYLNSDALTPNDLSLFVSAITLSLLTCFDEKKMLWLIEAFYHKQLQVKIRAQVGFVLIAHKHYKRISLYQGIMARINLIMDEQSSFANDINDTFIQLLRSQDTERINKTMSEDIVPAVMKKVHDIQQRKSISEDSDEMDINPEWMFDFGPKLNNKMRKIGELQMEGGDVNMATFSQMKRFKFFESMPNWFYPFDPLHSTVYHIFSNSPTGDNKLELKLMQTGMLCDSDCYSLAFMLKQIAQDQHNMMLSQVLPSQAEELIEEADSDNFNSQARLSSTILKNYIQDLYRFFKLSPMRGEFEDPFLSKLDFYKNPILKASLQDPYLLQKAADFLFKAEKYTDAIDIYAYMFILGTNTPDIYQRAGFCEQKSGNYEKAVDYYEKADTITSGSTWTLRHLAACYRHLHEFDKALDCYTQLLTIEADNLSFLYGKACCLAEVQQFEKALQCFYQIDLAEENSIKAWRGIAWCSFMSDKNEQAQKYYEKIINSNPNEEDWLNAGHVAWCQGNLSQALGHYRMASSLSSSYGLFRKTLLADQKTLESKGISSTDFLLMLELI